MKSVSMQRLSTTTFFAIVGLAMLLLSSRFATNINYENADTKIVTQDTTAQDTIIIEGTVVDMDHLPLEMVEVSDNNSDREVMSDLQGVFRLTLNAPTTISFTKAGYDVVEHDVTESDSNIMITLSPLSNEVIVNGYGKPSIMKEKNESHHNQNDASQPIRQDTSKNVSVLQEKYKQYKDSMNLDNKKMKDWEMDHQDSSVMNMNHHKTNSQSNINNEGVDQMDSTRVKKYINEKADSLSNIEHIDHEKTNQMETSIMMMEKNSDKKADSLSNMKNEGIDEMDTTRVKQYMKQKADSLSRMDEKKKSWNDSIKEKETRMRVM